MSLVLKNRKGQGAGQGGSWVGQALQCLLWIGVVSQLVWGIQLVGEGARFWSEAFKGDHEREICGRYRAMEANLRDAVTTWRKLGCAGEEELLVEEELEEVLMEWQEKYAGMDLENCEGVRLHRERNPDLDEDYPNWVLRYE